jgi:hypothetical protein
MKKIIFAFAILGSALAVITACNKGQLSGQAGPLVASSYKPQIMQPDSLYLSGTTSGDSLVWSVTPPGADSLIVKNNTALVFFKKAGVYQVTVSSKNSLPAKVTINVSDSVYHPPVGYVYTPLTGDQLTLIPHYVAGGDSTYLSFLVETKNSYCTSSKLQATDSLKNNTYGINFVRVIQPNPCATGDGPLAAYINFTANQPAALTNGTYPLSITLNGIIYTGSIVVSTNTISFSWNYTSGVLISPTQISR